MMSWWRRFRQLYPLATVLLVSLLGCDAVLHWVYGYLQATDCTLQQMHLTMRTVTYCVLTSTMMLFRANHTNPTDSAYLGWLRTTPWTIARPLPLGPMFLTRMDWLVIAILTALAWLGGPIVHPAAVPVAMLLFHVLITGAPLLDTQRWKPILVALLFIIVAVLLFTRPWLMLGVVVLLHFYITAQVRELLLRFHEFDFGPRDAEHHRALIFWGPDAEPTVHIAAALGTTHALPHHDRLEPKVPLWQAAVAGLVAGTAAYFLSWFAVDEGRADLPMSLGAFVIVAAAFGRTIAYVSFPPISLWGRVRTRRWIIPRFDRALVVPLVILAAGFLTMWLLHRCVVPLPWVAAATLALTTFIALGAGPTRGAHRLTAAQHYRAINFEQGNVRTSAPSSDPAPRRKRTFART
ncbi:MAG: hypothetical protein H6816_05575 [Phycisphaerales bacterium]|nr:hypothetical protein [Phycisphaerales bacterium]